MNPVEAIRSACDLGLLPVSGALTVGFSGGPDSAALLHALCSLGRWRVAAVHVDHGLRPESAREAERAGQMARAWGADFQLVRLAGLARGEEAARLARHRALAERARAIGSQEIVLAHHADDQLETLLLRLARGSGGAGLGGMRPREPGLAGVEICRPLLALTREEIEAYCAEHALAPLQDPTNADPAHASRNRLRLQAVPVLRELNPRAAQAAARLARILAEENDALEELARRTQAALEDETGALDVAELGKLPRAVARRVIRLLAPGLGFEQTEQALAFARPGPPAHAHLGGDALLVRQSGRVRAVRGGGEEAEVPGACECRRCLTRARPDPSMEREIPE